MDIPLSKINYKFLDKPLLVGGRAKEYYNIRKSGADIDLIISSRDFEALSLIYKENLKEIFSDKGLIINEFEIWKTICLFDYDFLSKDAIELESIKVISLEKLVFLTALASKDKKIF